jgi:hypothetical protein
MSLPVARSFAALGAALIFMSTPLQAAERQVTRAAHGHILTNVNVWSPDSRWIVYDERTVDSVFDGTRIAQVDVGTGEVRTLFESRDGAACGVATYHPRESKVVFILGPEKPTPEWSYGASRRRGVIVEAARPGTFRPLEAMNYAPPFAPGALRGGSHVHVFAPEGRSVSFTYDDEILSRLGPAAPGAGHETNQRNVAIAVRGAGGPDGVTVNRHHPRNHDGEWFAVVVTRTVNAPRPGSDEIGRAYEEGWLPARAGRQRLAFLGNVVAPDGREHAEIFLVEVPADVTRAGERPLEGTPTLRPAPPRGTVQRRLTFTSGRKFPGVAAVPRHWVRAAPDGGQLAFLMRDEAGVVQLWLVAPDGGEPRQVTRNATGVASAFSWTPDGRHLAHTMDNSVCLTDVATGRTRRLTERTAEAQAPLPLACVVSPDGRKVAYQRPVAAGGRVFNQIFVTELP